jgi:DNA-directed RNA polymerase omega subunit
MLYPTIEELTQGKYNRYELALAAAKCARLITDEYVHQHEVAEKSLAGNKESERSLTSMIDRELRDEKAVKVAINRIHRGEYRIAEIEEADETETVDEEV